MDFSIRFGLTSGVTDEAVVVRELEEILTVFFEPQRTPAHYGAYDEVTGIGLALTFGFPVETGYERACPHVMTVFTDDGDPLGALGRVFARLAASGRCHAAMCLDDRDIAITRGVPDDPVDG